MMDYINGKLSGCEDTGTKETQRLSDHRLYLSEMTWPELEKYLKSITKRSRKSGNINH